MSDTILLSLPTTTTTDVYHSYDTEPVLETWPDDFYDCSQCGEALCECDWIYDSQKFFKIDF